MRIAVIGVDCATVDAKIGLSLVERSPGGDRLLDTSIGSSRLRPTDQIAKWIKGRQPVVLALDAPLGWPSRLADHLSGHYAGSSVSYSADSLFRRHTDRFVEDVLGKRPLEVGADRIARTAVSALGLLTNLRKRLGDPIPLVWSDTDLPPVSAIEVYPAATLRSRGLTSEGYKRQEGRDSRRQLFKAISSEISTDLAPPDIIANDDIFDGVICALAGLDFISGRAIRPPDLETAVREGWIWFTLPPREEDDEHGGDT